jgi:kynureninase
VNPTKVEDRLLDWRPEFPTVEATLHFISHSLGAMPRGAEESLRRYADTWKARSIRLLFSFAGRHGCSFKPPAD